MVVSPACVAVSDELERYVRVGVVLYSSVDCSRKVPQYMLLASFEVRWWFRHVLPTPTTASSFAFASDRAKPERNRCKIV